MRQLIIVRKDLEMTPGKLAAQVAHASTAWLTAAIKNNITCHELADGKKFYSAKIRFDQETYEDWMCGNYTKTICRAKNRGQLLRATDLAADLNLKEGEDYFLIKDMCFTELEPEDEDGTTLTCIGFRPLDDELAHTISKKYQLY